MHKKTLVGIQRFEDLIHAKFEELVLLGFLKPRAPAAAKTPATGPPLPAASKTPHERHGEGGRTGRGEAESQESRNGDGD